MKKFIVLVALSLPVMLSFLAFVAFAHTGGTDSKGGHTNHSTGEYHYHHGYPAHSHYDMDDDGDIDCPYDFDNQTNHSSGGNGNADSGNRIDSSNNSDNHLTVPNVQSADTAQEKVSFFRILGTIFECLLMAVGIGLSSSYLLSFLFLIIFGKDNGCSAAIISFFAISVIAFIVMLVIRL